MVDLLDFPPPTNSLMLRCRALLDSPKTKARATLMGALPGTAVTVYDALSHPVTTANADAAGSASLNLPVELPVGVYVVRAGSKTLRLTVE